MNVEFGGSQPGYLDFWVNCSAGVSFNLYIFDVNTNQIAYNPNNPAFAIPANTWTYFSLPLTYQPGGPWTSGVSLDWTQIQWIDFDILSDAVAPPRTFWVDNIAFTP